MSAKALKLLAQLREDLDLTGLDSFTKRVAEIEKVLAPASRKTKAVAPVVKFKLFVTEKGKSYEVLIENEKELDRWLTLKNKTHKLEVDKYLKGLPAHRHLPKPSEFYNNYRPDQYSEKLKEYRETIKAAGLELNVEIKALT